MVIDTHLHPLAGDPERYPLQPAGSETGWYETLRLGAQEILREMDAAGVDKTVLVQAYSAYQFDNRFCVEEGARHPDRFVTVCRVDPAQPGAPDQLGYWVQQRGCSGVRFGSAGPDVYPCVERAQQLGITVSVQIRYQELKEARALCERFPAVPFILDHLAHPPIEDGPPYAAAPDFWALAGCPNLHLKLTSMNIREAAAGKATPWSFIETLVWRFGANRICWGSDYPHTTGDPAAPYRDLVDMARKTLAFLPGAEREEILSGTARRLYPKL